MIDRQAFYEQRAASRHRELARHYQQLMQRYYRFLVPPEMRVLELGCSSGELLAALRPCHGVGVDFSPSLIDQARQRHPNLAFHVADVLQFSTPEKFDYIVLSDLVNDLSDVQALLSRLHEFSHERTRLTLNFFNNLWRPILAAAEKLGAKAPTAP